MTASQQEDSQDTQEHVVDRFVTAVQARMDDLGLTQIELASRCGNFSQKDVSDLCNTKGNKREPEWKKENCRVLKRSDLLASLWRELELDDDDLLRELCGECEGLDYQRVTKLVKVRAATGYCPSVMCPGATFVPQGLSVLVVPFQKRIGGNQRQSCSWCGEQLATQCPYPDCDETVLTGPTCNSCDQPLVPCPAEWDSATPEEKRELCTERNADHETLRRQIRDSRNEIGQ